MKPGSIEIHTDGACSGNPGPGGWGAVIRSSKGQREISGGEKDTTNNRMEMQAAIEALKATPKNSSITLFTDSSYLKDGLTKWMKGWKKNGWKTADKKPVKNQDLWEELDTLTTTRDIEWQWVKGHAGDVMNERADTLAREAIPGAKKATDPTSKKKSSVVADYFAAYAEAFSAFDAKKIISLWAFPAMITSPEQTKIFETAAPFAANLEKLMAHYAKVGMDNVSVKIDGQKKLSDAVTAVEVTFTLQDSKDKKIAGWKHGYVLRETNGVCKAIASIADGEVAVWKAYKK